MGLGPQGASSRWLGPTPPFKRTHQPPKGPKHLDGAREVARKQGQLRIMSLPVLLRWSRSQNAHGLVLLFLGD